jgi:hypothetical protein
VSAAGFAANEMLMRGKSIRAEATSILRIGVFLGVVISWVDEANRHAIKRLLNPLVNILSG